MIRRKPQSRFAFRPSRFSLERFEDRLTPALTTTFDSNFGQLSITSDGPDDMLLGVNGQAQITINGSPATTSTGFIVRSSEVRTITLTGSNFENHIDVSGLTSIGLPKITPKISKESHGRVSPPIVVFGGSGNDTITASPLGTYMKGDAGADLLIGGDGPDHMVVDGDDEDCDGKADFDILEFSIPATATTFDASCDPDAGVSSFSWGVSQTLTVHNAELFSGTIPSLHFSVTDSSGASEGRRVRYVTNIGSSGQDGVEISVEGKTKGKNGPKIATYDLAVAKGARVLSGGTGNDTFTIEPGSSPVSVEGGAGADVLQVNNYGYPSSVSTSSVQVQGLAPVSFSGDVETAIAKHKHWDADAISDLKIKGISVSTSASRNTDGTLSTNVTITNNSPLPLSELKIRESPTLPRLRESPSKASLGRITGAGPGGGPHIRVSSVSPGSTVSVYEDPDFGNSLASLQNVVSGVSFRDRTIEVTGPPIVPGGSSMSASFRYHDWRWVDARSCVVTCVVGSDEYAFDLRDYFTTGDIPSQPQFATSIDAVTGKPASNGSSSVVSVDATGSTQLVASSATGIDSSITSLSAGLHLYVGGQLVDRVPGTTKSGNGQSNKGEVCADGSCVVFQSTSSDLVSGVLDTNATSDIFLTDLTSGSTIVLSKIGIETANGKSFNPQISADGSTVIFLSLATNLIPGLVDTNNGADLFSYDVASGSLQCLSLSSSGTSTGDRAVIDADLDGDGFTISWLTNSADVGTGNPTHNLLCIRKAGGTPFEYIKISKVQFDTVAHSAGLTASIDGSTVYIWTNAAVDVPVPDTNNANDILSWSFGASNPSLVSASSSGLSTSNGACPSPGERVSLSFDGSVCAFTSTSTDLEAGTTAVGKGLYEWIKASSAVHRLDSFSGGGFGDNNSSPSVSADGTQIAFVSTSDYTSPTGGTSPFSQIFVADTLNNRIQRVSSSQSGVPGNGNSSSPIMCANGTCVAFSSLATNIVAGDNNLSLDAFCSRGHKEWILDLAGVSLNFTKIKFEYRAADDSIVAIDIPTSTVFATRPASSTSRITIFGRDGVDDELTFDLTTGLTRLTDGVGFVGGTGNDTVSLLGLLLPAVQKIRESPTLSSGRDVQHRLSYSPPGQTDDSLGDFVVETCDVESSVSFNFTKIEYSVVGDPFGTTNGGTVTVSNSVTDLIIDAFNSHRVKDFWKGSSQSLDVTLSPRDDVATIGLNGLPPGQPVIRCYGGLGNDTITAATTTSCAVEIDGEGGDDVCTGGSLADTMVISQGKDSLSGGNGEDTFERRISDVRIVHPPGTPPGTWRFAKFEVTIDDTSSSNMLDLTLGPPISIDLSSTVVQQVTPTSTLRFGNNPDNICCVASPYDDSVSIKGSSVARMVDGGADLGGGGGAGGDLLIVDAQGHAACDVGGRIIFAGGFAPIDHKNFENVVITNNAPTLQVVNVQINDGSPQRSRVTSVRLAFSGQVDFGGFPPAEAFKLMKNGGSSTIPLNASVASNNGFTSVTLTFSGAGTEFGSLADGRYTLSVLASKASSSAGPLDGNGDGMPGDDYVLSSSGTSGVYRLFGDFNGDGTVASNDFIQFRLALGGNSSIFDFDGDGAVAASDFIQFRLRFGGSI